MSHSYCQSPRSLFDRPPLSAIEHSSNPTNFRDGICLPSTCHSRTWLLDSFQETRPENPSCRLTACKQDHFTEGKSVRSSGLPGAVRTTCSNPKPSERPSHQSRGSSAVLEPVSQSRQSASSQQVGLGTRRCQPASYTAKRCSLKTSVSQSCQTAEYESSQCQSQVSESNSCSPLVRAAPGPQLPEPSTTHEPVCCVTGGWQLPSK